MSVVAAVAVLVVMVAVVNTRSARWFHVAPPTFDIDEDPAERAAKAQAHAAIISQANHDRWRRVALLGAIALWCLGVAFLIAYDASQQAQDTADRLARVEAQRTVDECRSRNEGRADARASDVAVVDVVGGYAGLDEDERAEVRDLADAASADRLPPLDCPTRPPG